jgi:hypothetical protein
MRPLSQAEGNGTRPVGPTRSPLLKWTALRGQPLVACLGWTGSPCSWGWPWR